MAEVTPPPRQRPSTAMSVGVALGVVLGSLVGVLIGVVIVVGSIGQSGCRRNIPAGLVELAIVAAVLFLPWYMFFRVKADSFWVGLLRGFSFALGIFMVIPWPCSVGFEGVANLVCH